jgi:4-alpha-glucanotransferase
MLPTQPVGRSPGFSPYSAPSAMATSPLVVSPEDLVARGLLERKQIVPRSRLDEKQVLYPATVAFRESVLRLAAREFAAAGGLKSAAYEKFVEAEGDWLVDWSVFAAARRACRNKHWNDWPTGLAKRQPRAMGAFVKEHADEVSYQMVVQFLAEQQWGDLRGYAAANGVGLVGDVPIFVSHDSADVWAHPELFKLDSRGRPKVVTGVPPDNFSKLGQKWNHPHYAWAKHAETGFEWFIRRFERVLSAFEVVRIDHFLGFNRVWEIPGTAKDARRGEWVKSPGTALFSALMKRLKSKGISHGAIIAEDLGVSTPEATALREGFKFPGMRVLQFGFGGGTEHLPLAYVPNCVAYTGTHDNETSAQWFDRIMKSSPREKQAAWALGLGHDEPAWQMVAVVANSPANTVIFPVQDLLQLGKEHRMNVPGTASGNWKWRMPGAVPADVLRRLRVLLETTQRCAPLDK